MKKKGFFAALFDLSFSEFITTKIIKVLYGIDLLFAGIAALVLVFVAFQRGTGLGILGLVLAPLAFVLCVVLSRIGLESTIVLFRIAENTTEIVKLNKAE